MNKKIVIIGILFIVLNISATYSVLTYFSTVEIYGIVKTPIPALTEVYQDQECTIKLTNPINFPEFTIVTGVEQIQSFFIRNNLNETIKIRWRLNSKTSNMDKWSDVGKGYFYAVPTKDNGWFLQLYWDYEKKDYIQTSYPSELCWRVLKANEIHKLTLYLKCPYNARIDVRFTIDIISEEIT